jgi:Cu(I)/Ag(I) efflux system membrane fusion protein
VNTSPEKAPTAPASQDTKESAEPDAKITEALAKLSTEDRALAEKQQVCLVSDEPLGAMGTPKKIEVKGQAVFICCESCEEDLLANPDKYLAKLKK